METVWDVVVVGGGPVGQTAAILLAQAGRNVAVVERKPSPYPLPRAVHFDDEAARVFQAAGIADELMEVTEPATRYELRSAGGEILLAFERLGLGASGWPASLAFAQPDLERILESRLLRLPNVELLRGWEAVSVTQGPDLAEIGLRGVDGAERRLQGRYVVGADGANSFVRERMDITVTDLGFHFDWLVVDVVPHEKKVWWPSAMQHCDPARPTTLVPSGPGRRRWEFMLLPGEAPADFESAEKAWELLRRWDIHPGNAVVERHAVYRFEAKWADRWRDGRLLLAGDAAHLMPPFFAQGLCSGVRDASALAWRLDLVLGGLASPDCLDAYGAERIGHVRTFIDISVELGELICVLDPEQAAARDAMFLGNPTPPADAGPTPRLGPGLYVDDDLAAGYVFIQGRVEHQGRTGLFDDVVGRGMTLLAMEGDDPTQLDAASEDWLKSVGGQVVRLTTSARAGEALDVDGDYASWFEENDCRAVLVRPDNYVFGTAARLADAGALVAALREGLS